MIDMSRARRLTASLAGVATLALTGTACGGSARPFRIVSSQMVDGGAGFNPARLTFHKNDKVKLSVGNTTFVTHGFTIVGYGIQHEILPGNPIEVEFTASRAGIYEIRCQLHPAHRPATLVVE